MEQPDGPESSNRMGVLIEFPGLVRNTTRALERITLGTEHPELSFDPSNQWRPPIKGSYAPALGLVVQVSRDPHTKQIVETRVIGKYNKICRFRSISQPSDLISRCVRRTGRFPNVAARGERAGPRGPLDCPVP